MSALPTQVAFDNFFYQNVRRNLGGKEKARELERIAVIQALKTKLGLRR